MSVKSELQTVKKMIDAGMYEEARSILTTIDHPVAKKWLANINRIAPVQHATDDYDDDSFLELDYSAAQDSMPTKSKNQAPSPRSDAKPMLAVAALLVVIGVLIIGGIFLLGETGLGVGGFEPPISGDNTECGGQDWVNRIDGSFNEIYRYNLWEMLYFTNENFLTIKVNEDLRTQQLDRLYNSLERIEDEEYPDCVAGSREDLIGAYETLIEATEIFDPENPIYAFGRFGKTLTSMESAGSDLVDLGARFRRVDGEAVASVTDKDCPAYAYVTRTMYVDNQFILMIFVDPGIATLEQYQSFSFDLSQQYYRVKDNPNVPPCLWEVRNTFVEIIDGLQSAYQAGLGLDFNGMDVHLERYDKAWDKFYEEIQKVGLDPVQFGSWIVVDENR